MVLQHRRLANPAHHTHCSIWEQSQLFQYPIEFPSQMSCRASFSGETSGEGRPVASGPSILQDGMFDSSGVRRMTFADAGLDMRNECRTSYSGARPAD